MEEQQPYNTIKPSHHKGKTGMQVWDVIEEFELSFMVGSAASYLLRAGKKPGADYIEELEKTNQFILKEIEFEKQRRLEVTKK